MSHPTHSVVKIRIRRGNTQLGQNRMLYPDRFDSNEITDAGGIGPLNGSYSGHISRGGNEAWCFFALPHDLADEYAQDPDMEIVSAEQADADMELWRIQNGRPSIVVRDANRIQAIRAKQEAGIALDQEDMDALDCNADTPGVNQYLSKCNKILSRIPIPGDPGHALGGNAPFGALP